MRRKLLERLPIYLLGFILPPISVATLVGVSSFSSILIHKNPDPLPAATASPSPAQASAPAADKRPTAVVLLSNAGTELTDFLAPYELLSASGFRVTTAAPLQQLSPTNGPLGVIPDQLLSKTEAPDLIVVPAVMDYTNTALIGWLKESASKAKAVLVLCEGARLAAQSGLLVGKTATSHFLAIRDLRKQSPTTTFVTDRRYVVDGKIISSAGVTGSMDATLEAIAKLQGEAAADRVARDFGYARTQARSVPAEFGVRQFAPLALHAAMDWSKRAVDVLVYPGVSETSLAAAIEPWPRTLAAELTTVAPVRTVIKTRFGLQVVPELPLAFAGTPDLLIVPSGVLPNNSPASTDPLKENLTSQWVRENNIAVKSFLFDPPGKTWDRSFELLNRMEGPELTRLAAELVEYPLSQTILSQSSDAPTSAEWTRSVLLKFLGLGLLGIGLAWMFERQLLARARAKAESAMPTGAPERA
jgi:transcriptional regulator GlxA family with amidase domain